MHSVHIASPQHSTVQHNQAHYIAIGYLDVAEFKKNINLIWICVYYLTTKDSYDLSVWIFIRMRLSQHNLHFLQSLQFQENKFCSLNGTDRESELIKDWLHQ